MSFICPVVFISSTYIKHSVVMHTHTLNNSCVHTSSTYREKEEWANQPCLKGIGKVKAKSAFVFLSDIISLQFVETSSSPFSPAPLGTLTKSVLSLCQQG